MKRIVFISDTHTLHRHVSLPKGDILVHCGDFTSRGLEREVVSFIDWLKTQAEEFEHVVFIAGNHDMSFEFAPAYIINILEQLPDNIHYLQDSEVVLDGIKFYGSPWQPEFFDWAFNLPRGNELASKWEMIPNDTDVLITHGPPEHVLDRTRLGEYVGCADLLCRVNEIKPKIHAFGHIHEGYGSKCLNGVTFINASICTLNYKPYNAPVVVEYDGNNVEFVTY